MRVRLILIVAAGVLLGTLAAAPPAEAGHLDWTFGLGFHVDGLHFRVGFGPPGYGYHPGPFFVTPNRLHHRGYGCHGACFYRAGSYYHHRSCPLLGFHLGIGGYGPDYFVRQYSPYRGYWGRGYRPYPNRAYGYYYRDGYRHRYRSPGGHYYRDRHHRDRHYRDRHRGDRHRGRHDRSYRSDRHRGRHHLDDGDSDSERHYRNDRGRRGNRDRAQPRGRAHRTRPPR